MLLPWPAILPGPPVVGMVEPTREPGAPKRAPRRAAVRKRAPRGVRDGIVRRPVAD